jgi:Ca2+-transporting ATPase
MNRYNQPVNELILQLNTDANGIPEDEARKRLKEYGLNELQEKKKMSIGWLFLNQFKDFMILVLLAAAALSGLMGDFTDTVIILVIVILNALIGFFQEYRAEKTMQALKNMSITQSRVLRGGKQEIVSSVNLVPGDIVMLEAGNIVPADIRLMETHSLRIDESSLTGESVPVDKTSTDISAADLPLGDQLNMVFKGTL